MSNAFLRTEASDIPTIPTQFTTDDGIAVPASNNLNIFGGSTSEFNDHGIETFGSGDTVSVKVTNRASGQITTTDATPTTIITLALDSSASMYSIEGFSTAIATGTGDGATYFLYGGVKTNGLTATEVGSESNTYFEDSSFIATGNTTLTTSGNNVLIQVTGVAATTINWDAVLTFRRVQ